MLYPGGLIRARPNTLRRTGGSGVFTLPEAFQAQRVYRDIVVHNALCEARTADATSHTYATPIGSAQDDRLMVAFAHVRDLGSTADITGATLGGVAMTELAAARFSATNSAAIRAYGLWVPSGTVADTQNLVVSYNESVLRGAAAVYWTTGVKNPGGTPAADGAPLQLTSGSASSLSGQLSAVKAGSVVLAAGSHGAASAAAAIWTGVDEDGDIIIESAINRFSCGHRVLGVDGDHTVGVNWSVSVDDTCMVALVLEPA